MTPVLTRPWEIWLVHHTHVDLGYTEPQDVVFRKHAEFLAQVLDFCAATDQLPDGERFIWTCEVSWTVKAFLARFPERAEEFFRRVREGRIEVTALYLQLTDLFTRELLEETTDYAIDLYTAAVEAGSLVQDAMIAEAAGRRDEQPGILVFNPGDHMRSDVVELLAADVDLGLPSAAMAMSPMRTEAGPAFHLVDETTGVGVAVERAPIIADSARRPAQRIRFMVGDLPARGFRRYRVVPGEIEAPADPNECMLDVTRSANGACRPFATPGVATTGFQPPVNMSWAR